MTLRTVELMTRFKELREKFFAIEEAHNKVGFVPTETQHIEYELAKNAYHYAAVSVAESLINLS